MCFSPGGTIESLSIGYHVVFPSLHVMLSHWVSGTVKFSFVVYGGHVSHELFIRYLLGPHLTVAETKSCIGNGIYIWIQILPSRFLLNLGESQFQSQYQAQLHFSIILIQNPNHNHLILLFYMNNLNLNPIPNPNPYPNLQSVWAYGSGFNRSCHKISWGCPWVITRT